MRKKKKVILAVVLSALLITVGISLCAGVASENNSGELTTQTKQVFSDVKETDWFYSDVGYVNEQGLMQGTSDTLFASDNSTTRGMLVTILWRLDGKPIENGKKFSDVVNDTYYYDAVSWASKFGIVNGYTESTFSPDDNITREQLASIFYRYAEYKKYDVSAKSELDAYADKTQISDYAVSAMQWANANGIITGTTENTLSPQGNALRCQIAAILKRFCTQIIPTNPDNEVANTPTAENTSNKDNHTSSGNSNYRGSVSDTNHSSKSENTDNPLIIVNDISAKTGEEIQISVTLKNNPGILGMALMANYDETVLTLQSVENGEAFKDILEMTPSKTLNSGARFLWDGIDISDSDIKDGTILLMNFKVNNNAKAGKYPITLQYSDGDIVDNNLTEISPQTKTGYITIIK